MTDSSPSYLLLVDLVIPSATAAGVQVSVVLPQQLLVRRCLLCCLNLIKTTFARETKHGTSCTESELLDIRERGHLLILAAAAWSCREQLPTSLVGISMMSLAGARGLIFKRRCQLLLQKQLHMWRPISIFPLWLKTWTEPSKPRRANLVGISVLNQN